MKKLSLVQMTAALALMTLAAGAFGGVLNPPAGPSAGTMKTLDQVEPRTPISSVPYTITQSGSYYLTKNLTSTGTAITIQAGDVTLDLCGFTLTGPNSGPSRGVEIGPSLKNIEIRNGTITQFSYYGAIYSGIGQNYRVIGVQCVANRHSGIVLNGNCCIVKDCVVIGNAEGYSMDTYGILVPSNSIVTGNAVYSNGLSTANGSFYAIKAGSGSRIESNVVSGNGTGHWGVGTIYGIWTDGGCKVSGNTVRDNAGIGINTGDSGQVTGNVVVSNTLEGILCAHFCTVSGNTVTGSGGNGIFCNSGTVADNTVVQNNTSGSTGKGGIVVEQQSLVRNNLLEGNAKSNIRLIFFRTVVEGNVMSGSDFGIYFGSTGNAYLNNRATSNGTNYGNTAGNTDGGGNLSF